MKTTVNIESDKGKLRLGVLEKGKRWLSRTCGDKQNLSFIGNREEIEKRRRES